MTYTVSITSQGQISLPAKLRRELFAHTNKALVSVQDDRVILEPVKDILNLESLKTSRKGKVSSRQMREAFGQYLADEAVGKND